MDEMVGQEADRLVPVRCARNPPLDGCSKAGDDLGRIGEASRAMPVDGIHVGVDLEQAGCRDGG